MATGASCGDAGVIHLCAFKTGGGVASFTGSRGGYMCSRLTNSFSAIMATSTTAANASVIHRATFETDGILMTSFTSCTGDNVATWLGFHIRKTTTVTSCTTSSNTCVTHCGWRKGFSILVTSFTHCVSWNMVSRFTQCGFTIMAASATCSNAGVAHRRAFKTGSTLVTAFTSSASRYMGC